MSGGERKFASLDDLDEDFILLSHKNGKIQGLPHQGGRLSQCQKWPSLSSLVDLPAPNVRTSFGDFVNCLRSDGPGSSKMEKISESRSQLSEEPSANLKAFMETIDAGDLERFKELHEDIKDNGLELSDETLHYGDGRNVLHLALRKGGPIVNYIISVSQPQFLIESYINSTGSTMYKTTALHMIVEQNNTELTELFMSKLIFLPFWKQYDYMKSLTTINIGENRVQLMTPLHIASMNGNLKIIKMLVNCGTTVDVVNESRETPFMWAIWGNHFDAVKYLLELGASPNHEDDKGSTPLYWATRYGNAEIVHYFLTECRVNVNHKRKFGYVLPLVLASAAGHAKIVQDLLEHGAKVDYKVTGGKTALHHAATQGHDEIIKILLEFGAKINAVDDNGNTALMLATRECKSQSIQTLLSKGADMHKKNKMGQTVWDFIMDSPGTSLLRMYVQIYKLVNHIAPDVEFSFPKGKTPIHIAALKNDVSKVQCFLDLHLSWKCSDDMGNTFLHTAARENCLNILEEFAPEFDEAIANDHGDTPLHVAVKNGHLEAVKFLLSRSSLGARNKMGSTPLHMAAWSDKETNTITRLLVETIVGCSRWSLLDAKDFKGNTALHIAAKRGRIDIIEELSALDTRVTNHDGNNPLHVAALYGGPTTLEAIMDVFMESSSKDFLDAKSQRFNLNQVNGSGDTLLHICACQGDYENVKSLIENGANLAVRNHLGNTILHDLAEQSVLVPSKKESFLKVYNVIVELSPVWWCKWKGYHIPEEDSPMLAHYQRSAMLHLTSDMHNAQGQSAVKHCVRVAASSLLEAILNTPRVFRIADEYDYHFDVSNMTPDTRVTNCQPQDPQIRVLGSVSSVTEVNEPVTSIPLCKESVLDIIASSKNEVQATKMLDITPVKQIVRNYWTAYQLLYGFFMLFHIIYMIFYTNFGLSSVTNHDHGNKTLNLSLVQLHTFDYDIDDHPTVYPGILYLIWPSMIVIFEIYYLVSYSGRKSWSRFRMDSETKKCSRLYKTCINLPYVIFSSLLEFASLISGLLFSICVYIWYGFVQFANHEQAYILSVSLLLGWTFTISFAKGFETVHAFSIILKHIFVRDITRFLFIYCFVMLGFALAFHALFQMVPLFAERYHSPWDTFFMTLNVMLGLEDSLFEDFESSYSTAVAFIKVTYVGYVLLSSIILFNLLIAMMTDTYSNIISREGTTWRLGSVRLALKIEHSFPFLKKAFKKVGIIRSTTRYDAKYDRWMMTIPKEYINERQNEQIKDASNTTSRIESRLAELQMTCQNLTNQMETLMRCIEMMNMNDGGEQGGRSLPASRKCSMRYRRGSLKTAVQRWRNKALFLRQISTEPNPVSPVSVISPDDIEEGTSDQSSSDSECSNTLESGHAASPDSGNASPLSQSLQEFASKWKEQRSTQPKENTEKTPSIASESEASAKGHENKAFTEEDVEEDTSKQEGETKHVTTKI